MQRGDHLITPRRGYAHHGLYLGQRQVIHYVPRQGVRVVSLGTFSQGRDCTVRLHRTRRYDTEASIARARRRLHECRYHLLFNNCEHFVTWCIQGRAESRQVSMAATTLGSAALSARVLPLLCPSRRPDPFLTAPAPGLGQVLTRYTASGWVLAGPVRLTATASSGQLAVMAAQVLGRVVRMAGRA
ncbi:lecithin retinol acyltransferase family protein [Laribacter hongkongensis]|uniref:lecithin retinol acyltransferase family protein n=1 Tax=Laribacter hongkongensis TaxID=168471 RepID=UPI001EFEECF3|nr:lecithin retinol acyltransferase family protein [Laribacter hongkongensis]MCG9060135.1 lecithin retinol acyltransferase family protein [Laribacter hongkongensis]MCG9087240.1 lecithin retinol acyltransferase family protein [Laribacter hongkongensis]